jgi:flagellar biosynthesis/type III secretory pathway chaperone
VANSLITNPLYYAMNDNWESEIASLLTELAAVQGDLLGLLAEKWQILARGDHDALLAIAGREQQLIDRLNACHQQRQQLLARAANDGLPSDSIRGLSAQLSPEGRSRISPSIKQAAERGRILQQQCLTNWVLVQRTLLHLSQMIEIIATGGRPMPTYGDGSDRACAGALVDRAA